MTLEPILVFCVVKVDLESIDFNRPVNKFPPNRSVTFEGGKFSQVTSCHHLANMANNLTHQ